jgi:hypothetical protein
MWNKKKAYKKKFLHERKLIYGNKTWIKQSSCLWKDKG